MPTITNPGQVLQPAPWNGGTAMMMPGSNSSMVGPGVPTAPIGSMGGPGMSPSGPSFTPSPGTSWSGGNASSSVPNPMPDNPFMGGVLNNTEGRGNATMNDPVTGTALGVVGGAATGAIQPYSPQTQQLMETKHNDATAAEQAGSNRLLEDQAGMRGGNINDPSYQTAIRENADNRALNDNAYLGDVMLQSNLANFGAQQDAAQQLAQIRAQQLGQANNMFGQAANYQSRMGVNGPHVNAWPMPPMYQPPPDSAGAPASSPSQSSDLGPTNFEQMMTPEGYNPDGSQAAPAGDGGFQDFYDTMTGASDGTTPPVNQGVLALQPQANPQYWTPQMGQSPQAAAMMAALQAQGY